MQRTGNDRTDKRVNSKQINSEKRVISEKRVLVSRDGDHKSKDVDGYLRMRYGRIIRKPDKLAYQYRQCIYRWVPLKPYSG